MLSYVMFCSVLLCMYVMLCSVLTCIFLCWWTYEAIAMFAVGSTIAWWKMAICHRNAMCKWVMIVSWMNSMQPCKWFNNVWMSNCQWLNQEFLIWQSDSIHFDWDSQPWLFWLIESKTLVKMSVCWARKVCIPVFFLVDKGVFVKYMRHRYCFNL